MFVKKFKHDTLEKLVLLIVSSNGWGNGVGRTGGLLGTVGKG